MFRALIDTFRAYSLRLRPPQPGASIHASTPTPLPPATLRRAEPAAAADRAEQLRQARALLHQSAHLARYHQPALAHQIHLFLTESASSAPGRSANQNLA